MSLLQGLSILTVVMVVFLLALSQGLGEEEARSLAFVTMVFSNLMLILTNLSKSDSIVRILQHRNKALYWVLGGTVTFLFLVLYVPFLRNLFHFSYLHMEDLLLGIVMSFLGLLWFEVLKAVKSRKILFLRL